MMPHTVVIFGASGDLTRRKLIPALYSLLAKKRLPTPTRIVGVSRSVFTDEQWRHALADSTREFVGDDFEEQDWQRLAEHIHYQACDLTELDDMGNLAPGWINWRAASRPIVCTTWPPAPTCTKAASVCWGSWTWRTSRVGLAAS